MMLYLNVYLERMLVYYIDTQIKLLDLSEPNEMSHMRHAACMFNLISILKPYPRDPSQTLQ